MSGNDFYSRLPPYDDIECVTAGGNEYIWTVCSYHKREHCPMCFVDWRDMNQNAKREAESRDSLLCHVTGCPNEGSMVCGACKMVKYCGKECQKLDWKVHKQTCSKAYAKKDPKKATGNKKGKKEKIERGHEAADLKGPQAGQARSTGAKIRINVGSPDGPDTFVEALPLGTRVTLITGDLEGDTVGTIVAFKPGKGVLSNPERKLERHELRDVDLGDVESFCHYCIEIEGSRERQDGRPDIWKVECEEVHSRWEIEPVEESEESSAAPLSNASSLSPEVDVTQLKLPARPKYLVMTGFGWCDLSNCFYLQALRPALETAKIPCDCRQFESKDQLIKALVSGQYSACILLGVGANGPEIMRKLSSPDLQKVVVGWVTHAGGKLLMQGEGCLAKLPQDWFGCRWAFQSYCRVTQERATGAGGHDLPNSLLSKLPASYSAKAVHLVGVDSRNAVYSGAGASVAVKAVGSKGGRLGIFGDVNAEQGTIVAMVAIGL
jgi:MYND finger